MDDAAVYLHSKHTSTSHSTMKPLTAAGLVLCASLLAPVSARYDGDRTARVHLLGPRSSSSTSQPTGQQYSSIVHNAAGSSSSASYSPSDANVLMSAFLSIEEYEVLRDGLQVPDQLTMQPFAQEHEGTLKPLLIISEDMSAYGFKRLLPSLEAEDGSLARRLVHGFNVESTPGPGAWMELLETYRDRIAEKFGTASKDEDDDDSSKQAKRMMMPPVPGALAAGMALGPEVVDEVYTSYVTALQNLAALQDGEVDSANVPVIQLRGLREIAIKFGLQSEELKKAQEMLSITAEGVLASYSGKILLVSLPVNLHHVGHNHKKHLRSGSSSSIAFSTRPIRHSYHKRTLSSLADKPATKPLVPTSVQCFTSQDTCSNTTSSCYGHGQCVQGRKAGTVAQEAECWVCQCSNTKDEDGKTHYWSGAMCQKEDVSSPFFLLVGASFMLILVSAAAVVLLAKVGSEALPSTLAALGGGPGHRKHD